MLHTLEKAVFVGVKDGFKRSGRPHVPQRSDQMNGAESAAVPVTGDMGGT